MGQAKENRWIILGLSLFMLLGSRYCFELPAALKDSLGEKLSAYISLEEYEFFFNSFLSIYSLPNILLPFLNGYLIDRFGYKIMVLVCSAITALGHTIFAAGLQGSQFKLMIFGRFVFGIGSESVLVAQYSLLTRYFSGQELSLAMTLSSTMSTLGNVLNMLLTPRIAAYLSMEIAVWVGVLLCLVGLTCMIIVIVFLDKEVRDSRRLSFVLLKSKPKQEKLALKVKEFKQFDRIFWYISFTQFFLFSTITCWGHIGPSFLVEKWFSHKPTKDAQILAGNCLALIWLAAVTSGPFIGHFVDKYGLRPRVLVLATILCTTAMIMFSFVFPFVPSFLLGLSYSFGSASIFPCVAYVIPEENIGTANGLVISMQNLGYVIFPYIIASLKVMSGEYAYSQLFVIVSSLVAFRFAWLTYKENLKKGYNLEIEVELMGAVGVEVLELKSQNSENMDYKILNSDERF